MNAILMVLGSYLLGSIPTGYWVVKYTKGIDLLKVGSGSTGTTNVLRNAGKGAAGFVLVIDLLKGYIPVTVAQQVQWFPELAGVAWLIPWFPPICGIISMIGHSRSIFLHFKGGKSAATGCGTLIGCNLYSGFSSLFFWGFIVWASKIVSVASIVAALTCGLFMWYFTMSNTPYHVSFSIYATIGGLYVVVRHRANIGRLLKGTEPRIGQKPPPTDPPNKEIEQQSAG